MQRVLQHDQAEHVNVHVRRVDLICKCASETDDETDMELVDRLWRFLERETRNERKGRGTLRGAWQRSRTQPMDSHSMNLLPSLFVDYRMSIQQTVAKFRS